MANDLLQLGKCNIDVLEVMSDNRSQATNQKLGSIDQIIFLSIHDPTLYHQMDGPVMVQMNCIII